MPISYTGQVCEVSGFHKDFTPIVSVPVGTFATAHTDPITGDTVILIMHEALGFDTLDHSLISVLTKSELVMWHYETLDLRSSAFHLPCGCM